MPCHNRITVLRHRVGAPLAMRKPRRRPSRVTKAWAPDHEMLDSPGRAPGTGRVRLEAG